VDPKTGLGVLDSKRTFLLLSGIKPQVGSVPARSVVTVPSELSRPPFNAVRTEIGRPRGFSSGAEIENGAISLLHLS
jgi:hypothetical protein